jgi:hypothetical protein
MWYQVLDFLYRPRLARIVRRLAHEALMRELTANDYASAAADIPDGCVELLLTLPVGAVHTQLGGSQKRDLHAWWHAWVRTTVELAKAKGEGAWPIIEEMVFQYREADQVMFVTACLTDTPSVVMEWLGGLAKRFHELELDSRLAIADRITATAPPRLPQRLRDALAANAEDCRENGYRSEEITFLGALLHTDPELVLAREGFLVECVEVAAAHLDSGRWPGPAHDLTSQEDVDVRLGVEAARLLIRIRQEHPVALELLGRVHTLRGGRDWL